MRYVSIDLETTGLGPDECQIVELGAVIDDLVTPFSKLPIFRYRVQEPYYRGEPFALAMHAELFKELASADRSDINASNDIIDTQDRLTFRFANWLKREGINPHSFVVAGKNFANFDARFLRRLPQADRVKWHHRILDLGSMYMRITDSTVPSMRTCINRAGIDVSSIPGKTHTAVHDALVVCALIRWRLL